MACASAWLLLPSLHCDCLLSFVNLPTNNAAAFHVSLATSTIHWLSGHKGHPVASRDGPNYIPRFYAMPSRRRAVVADGGDGDGDGAESSLGDTCCAGDGDGAGAGGDKDGGGDLDGGGYGRWWVGERVFGWLDGWLVDWVGGSGAWVGDWAGSGDDDHDDIDDIEGVAALMIKVMLNTLTMLIMSTKVLFLQI